jgi:hypothetical protein
MVELLAMTLGGEPSLPVYPAKIQNSEEKPNAIMTRRRTDPAASQPDHVFAGRSSTGASSIRTAVCLRIMSSRFLDR